METLRFSSFDKKIFIKSTREALYRAFGTAGGLSSWFLKEAEFKDGNGVPRGKEELARANDTYTWKWHNWDGEETGLVTVADGRSLFEFEFTSSKVCISIGTEVDGRVLVHLRQYEIPTDDESKLRIHCGCSNGWTFWLANLKAWIEYGILLNETSIDLRDDPMAGFDFVNI